MKRERAPAGFHVDTIKEPSDGSLGDQTSPRPTRHAAVFPSLSCGLKGYTNHVNKYPELRILWFFTPDYKDAAAFVVAVQMQHGLLGCQNHVKSICTYKGRPIDINDAASSTECRKCAFEPVCAFERASVLGPGHSHLFPSRMDLMEATGHGADRFIRVVI